MIADSRLAVKLGWTDTAAGTTAAKNRNSSILHGLHALNASGQGDADPTRISSTEVRWIHAWIKADAARYGLFLANQSNDENGVENRFPPCAK